MFLSIYYYKSILIGLCKMMNNHSLCTALQIFTYCYNINDIIYMISSLSLSLSLSLSSDYNHHCCRIIVIIDSCVGGVGHHHPFCTLSPPSSSLFHRLHLLDLDCCGGCHGWGGSLMQVLLGFILGCVIFPLHNSSLIILICWLISKKLVATSLLFSLFVPCTSSFFFVPIYSGGKKIVYQMAQWA